jgi:Domain of unknown function (DUF4189)
MRRLYVLLASVVMATLLLAVASGASAVPAPAPKNKGALYISPSLQSSYFVSASRLNWALEGARYQCQQAANDCAPGVWVVNGYAAFVVDTTGAWGTGWGHTASIAGQHARTTCQTFGGVTCNAIRRSYRTTRYNPDSATHGGIPGVPPPVTQALPPAATGSGVGGTGQSGPLTR